MSHEAQRVESENSQFDRIVIARGQCYGQLRTDKVMQSFSFNIHQRNKCYKYYKFQ